MTTTNKQPQTPGDVLAAIAREKLGFETLDTRHSDSLDFRDVAVWSVKDALEAAYRAGLAAAKGARR
ncbi:hypothetical protein NVS55_08115 [Myxococcus stipitatus]|uniref:DUF6900 domain-containing protein n=1 Tax=Myxococcaceae TaxID=31 RepID=UPI001CBC1170|nr:hypothetical protein [Corallococcus sp. EGB]